jgi:hypothetical protein
VGVAGVDDVEEELLPPPQPESMTAAQVNMIAKERAYFIFRVLLRQPYTELLLTGNGFRD